MQRHRVRNARAFRIDEMAKVCVCDARISSMYAARGPAVLGDRRSASKRAIEKKQNKKKLNLDV